MDEVNKGAVFWLTGLSGAGKTTLSRSVAETLRLGGIQCLLLDGDICRNGLCSDLGFSETDRIENVRRVSEVAALCVDQGIICLCAFITPFESMRLDLRRKLGHAYHEIHVDCPLEECMKRDVKKLYARVRSGQIPQFTGIDSPYEVPTSPELRLDTSRTSIAECVREIISLIAVRLGLPLAPPQP